MTVYCPVDPLSGRFLIGCGAFVLGAALLFFSVRHIRAQPGQAFWHWRLIAIVASAADILETAVSVILLTTGPSLIVEYPHHLGAAFDLRAHSL